MKRFFPLLAFLVLIGCSTSQPQEQEQRAHLTDYRTFALAPLPTRGPESDPSAALRLAAPAREAIVSSLTQKGYDETPVEHADLLVKLSGEFSPDPFIEASERRKVIIQIVDNHTNRLIWSDFRARSGTQSASPDEVRAVIQQMLAPLPSRSELPVQ